MAESALALPSQRKWPAAIELALVLLIFAADALHLIPFSKTPFLVLLGWISLRIRKLSWKDVGLEGVKSAGVTFAIGAAAGTVLEVFQLYLLQPLLVRMTGKQPDLSVFRVLTGNVKLLVLGIALAWVLAAFGEEMVYRGYVMNRVADLGNGTPAAWIVSLVSVSVLFGFAHAYQGVTGVIEEGFAGLMLGVLYLGSGRNLWLPIIAHGAQDTIDAVMIFFGHYPGL